MDESRMIRTSAKIGRADIYLEREQSMSDTRVYIGMQTICWIAWDDRTKFLHDIYTVIEKHAI